MAFSTVDVAAPHAVDVRVDSETLSVDLSDGRTISVPVSWYPRLFHGTVAERKSWHIIGAGEGIHFPKLDEDISVVSLIAGKPSAESQASLQKWLTGRGR
jgi:hypothetical protein